MARAIILIFYYFCLILSGSFDTVSEAVCEYEDANLTWRNTPTYSFNDVKAMEWYKENGSLIATWKEGNWFIESLPYQGRLMQIGTSIKIKTANRSDSGLYRISLTLGSADHKLEAATHIVVIVTPSSYCKPNLTREGLLLRADLPAGVCGTPPLTLKWKGSKKTIIQWIQNSSNVLYLGIHPEPGEYMVCAEGESAKCYQGNLSDLCTSYNITDDVQNPVSDHKSKTRTIVFVVLALFVLIAISAIVVVKRCPNGVKCRNPYSSPEPVNFQSAGGNTRSETEKEDIFSIEERRSMDLRPENTHPVLEISFHKVGFQFPSWRGTAWN